MTTIKNDQHINWDKEFDVFMKLKGQKSTDMDKLLELSFLATVNCPDSMQDKFDLIFFEITQRSQLLDRLKLGL